LLIFYLSQVGMKRVLLCLHKNAMLYVLDMNVWLLQVRTVARTDSLAQAS